jgi:hypothetical protein
MLRVYNKSTKANALDSKKKDIEMTNIRQERNKGLQFSDKKPT